MDISAVCPVLNEEDHIEKVLQFFVSADPPTKELYLVDGLSADSTVDIIKKYQKVHPNINLLSNPDRYVSYALNQAIPLCKGKFIVRLDAHTEYEKDYFTQIISAFATTRADIVGGPMRPIGVTGFQKAVAFATCSKFGIGNSRFHDEKYKGYADSVYLGAWKRELFESTGYFDEDLIRNQDDEFHYRAQSKGFKIFLTPEIKSFYYPRSSFGKLFAQYFQYGLNKPLVLKKVPKGFKIRHLIPSLFCLYLISLLISYWMWWWVIPLIIYLVIDLLISLRSGLGLKLMIKLVLVFPILHISYGLGFLAGTSKTIS